MTGLDWKARATVPLGGGARIIGGRSLATEFVQAPAVARTLIVKGLGKFALIVERAAITAIVNRRAEEGFGAQMLVEVRYFSGCHILQQGAGYHLGDRRTPGYIDDRFA